MDKALLVGIGTYGHLSLSTLHGAVNALPLWKNVLNRHYSFPTASIHVLESSQAKKTRLITELQWLVSNATANDRVVFMFAGHGTMLNRPHPVTGIPYAEQGLVTYPESPTATLASSTLYGDEISDIVRRPPVRVTIGLDCCHSDGVIERPLSSLDLRPLYIDARDFGEDVSTERGVVTLLGRLVERQPDFKQSSTIVLSASRELESAYEGLINGVRHMAFSYHATKLLDQSQTHSHFSLRRDVAVLTKGIQVPQLRGDSQRYQSRFTY